MRLGRSEDGVGDEREREREMHLLGLADGDEKPIVVPLAWRRVPGARARARVRARARARARARGRARARAWARVSWRLLVDDEDLCTSTELHRLEVTSSLAEDAANDTTLDDLVVTNLPFVSHQQKIRRAVSKLPWRHRGLTQGMAARVL